MIDTYPLFQHMRQDYGMALTHTELNDIVQAVNSINAASEAAASLADNVFDAFAHVNSEVVRAEATYPNWPTDPLHAFAIVAEELGECQKEILQMCYEPHKSSKEKVKEEAIQLAAMAFRFLINLDKYKYKPCTNYENSTRPVH